MSSMDTKGQESYGLLQLIFVISRLIAARIPLVFCHFFRESASQDISPVLKHIHLINCLKIQAHKLKKKEKKKRRPLNDTRIYNRLVLG